MLIIVLVNNNILQIRHLKRFHTSNINTVEITFLLHKRDVT